MNQTHAIQMPKVSLSQLVQSRSRSRPLREAYTFVKESGEREVLRLIDVHSGAAQVAYSLNHLGKARGSRALIQADNNPKFILSFLGCLYAGVLPIPVSIDGGRLDEKTLEAVIGLTKPDLCLVTTTERRMRRFSAEGPMLPQTIDVIDLMQGNTLPDDLLAENASLSENAYIQFSSGSTGRPKGILISHSNLFVNEEMIANAFGLTDASVVVSWLPFHHDMGLVGGLLQPLFTGCHGVIMKPRHFVSRPLDWLRLIDEFQGTTSGAPNFGFDRCAASRENCSGLDLSSWKVAFVGAEPISPTTLQRFTARFLANGFDERSFTPCYGLAEATLMVTSHLRGSRRAITWPIDDGDSPTRLREVVNCGRPIMQEVLVVEENSLSVLPDSLVGDIYVRGQNVAQAYGDRRLAWQTFDQSIPGAGSGWLRTGDRGFMFERDLYVVDRRSDTLIIRGRKYSAVEIEAQLRTVLSLPSNYSVVVCREEDETVGVLIEGDHSTDRDYEVLVNIARSHIGRSLSLTVSHVKVLRRGLLPRTTSGKIRRQECAALLQRPTQRGTLSDWHGGTSSASTTEPTTLRQWLLERCHVALEELSPSAMLASCGIDSLLALELSAFLLRRYGREVSEQEILIHYRVADLVEQTSSHEIYPSETLLAFSTRMALEQERLWLIQELGGASTEFFHRLRFIVAKPLDVVPLREGMAKWFAEHESIATTFHFGTTGPERVLQENCNPLHIIGGNRDCVVYLPWNGLDDTKPKPKLNIEIQSKSDSAFEVYIEADHLVCDAVSLLLLADAIVEANDGNHQAPLSDQERFRYSAYIIRSREEARSEAAHKALAFWKQELDMLPLIENRKLRTEKPAIHEQRFRRKLDGVAACIRRMSSRMSKAEVRRCCLVAYSLALQEKVEHSTFAVGVVYHGRWRVRERRTFGQFAYPLPFVISPESFGPNNGENFIRAIEAKIQPFRETSFATVVRNVRPFALKHIFSYIPADQFVNTGHPIEVTEMIGGTGLSDTALIILDGEDPLVWLEVTAMTSGTTYQEVLAEQMERHLRKLLAERVRRS